jgi:hypothetical protein
MLHAEDPGLQALSRGVSRMGATRKGCHPPAAEALDPTAARILEHIAGRDPGLEAGN